MVKYSCGAVTGVDSTMRGHLPCYGIDCPIVATVDTEPIYE